MKRERQVNTLEQDLLLSRITAAVGLLRVEPWVVSDTRPTAVEVTGFQCTAATHHLIKICSYTL